MPVAAEAAAVALEEALAEVKGASAEAAAVALEEALAEVKGASSNSCPQKSEKYQAPVVKDATPRNTEHA